MFYRLTADYILRGWDNMSWTLVKRPKNKIIKLNQEQFQVLTLCDGETELPNSLLDKRLRKALQQCEAEGWIEPCKEPRPLKDDQYYRYYNNRCVECVLWSVTGRCNFRCRHCYVDGPDGKMGELSTEQAFDFIDQMAACGVLRVNITGGEPLVRKDFWQLIDRILSYKMTIGQFYTNGWLVDETVIEGFEKRGLKPDVQVSFDGAGWHDWMRGINGAEKAALKAMQLFENHNFRTNAAMCIHKGSMHSVPETIKALNEIGIKELRVSTIEMTDLWSKNCDGNDLTLQEYFEGMIPYITWYYQNERPIEHLGLSGVIELYKDKMYSINVSRYDGTEKTLDEYLCSVTRWHCYVTPEGRLLPCMPMASSPLQNRFPLIQDIGFRDGLSGSMYMKFVNSRVKDLFTVNQECAACEYRYKCGGGCRADAFLECGDLMACDPGKCMLHKNGYEERIRKIADEAIAKYGAPFAIENGSGVNE